jgi:hypothetical protein
LGRHHRAVCESVQDARRPESRQKLSRDAEASDGSLRLAIVSVSIFIVTGRDGLPQAVSDLSGYTVVAPFAARPWLLVRSFG